MKRSKYPQPIASGLPEGWTLEATRPERYHVIAAPRIGYVTLDLDERVFRSGVTYRDRPVSTVKYTGRDWYQRMVDDAVAWLEELA